MNEPTKFVVSKNGPWFTFNNTYSTYFSLLRYSQTSWSQWDYIARNFKRMIKCSTFYIMKKFKYLGQLKWLCTVHNQYWQMYLLERNLIKCNAMTVKFKMKKMRRRAKKKLITRHDSQTYFSKFTHMKILLLVVSHWDMLLGAGRMLKY